MNNVTYDLDYRDPYETDIFQDADIAAFERDLLDLQEDYDQKFDRFSGKRRKLKESENRADDVEAWPDFGIESFNDSLEDFKTSEYKAAEKLKELQKLKEQKQVARHKSLYESHSKKSSVQERFLQSLRNESKTIRSLEHDLKGRI